MHKYKEQQNLVNLNTYIRKINSSIELI